MSRNAVPISGRVDALECLVGSRSRAEVLAALFLDERRWWGLRELGRASGRPHQNATRELGWLVEAGVLRVAALDGKRSYMVDGSSPLARQLGQLVRQARGRVPELRRALERLSPAVVAWLTQACSPPTPAGGAVDEGSDLIVLSYMPSSLIKLQLAGLAERDVSVHSMSIAEWMARIRKGETIARRARRARKLWVVGSWEDLVRLERHRLEAERTLTSAVASWREELSDEWDEDWDPFDVMEGAGRRPDRSRSGRDPH